MFNRVHKQETALLKHGESTQGGRTTLLEQVEFIHRALPEISVDDIDLSVEFCGKKLSYPIWIATLPGRVPPSAAYVRNMAALANEFGLAFCQGDIRMLLEKPALRKDYEVRDIAPDTLLTGTIDPSDLAVHGLDRILDLARSLSLDGLMVQLGAGNEVTTPGGNLDFRGVTANIARLVELSGPTRILVKESGCGLSYADGELLKHAGIEAVEVCGSGGSSWIGVESRISHQCTKRGNEEPMGWGIPTAASTAWMVEHGFDVISGGGIRTGADVAAALALGAKVTGIGAPFVRCFDCLGIEAVREFFREITGNLRHIMLLTGARTPGELAQVPVVIGPELERWIVYGMPGKRAHRLSLR